MALLFLVYGLVLAAFAAMLFWLILRAYKGKIDVYHEDSLVDEFESHTNVVSLSAFKKADIEGLRLLQEYSRIESSNIDEREKLKEIVQWNKKLSQYEQSNRKIIQSNGFLKPIRLEAVSRNRLT